MHSLILTRTTNYLALHSLAQRTAAAAAPRLAAGLGAAPAPAPRTFMGSAAAPLRAPSMAAAAGYGSVDVRGAAELVDSGASAYADVRCVHAVGLHVGLAAGPLEQHWRARRAGCHASAWHCGDAWVGRSGLRRLVLSACRQRSLGLTADRLPADPLPADRLPSIACSTSEEYAGGHAPGAVNVPVMLKQGGGMAPNPQFLEQVRADEAGGASPAKRVAQDV